MTDLRKAVEEYLTLRRALGFILEHSGRFLQQFLSFVEDEGADWITTELALRWATSKPNAQPAERAARLRAVRLFAQHRKGTDSRTEIPPVGLLPHRPERVTPYIYSQHEITATLEAARQLPPRSGLRGWTVATLLGLLAVTGLRISEAVGLDRRDVDLDQGLLYIQHSKFDKSRLVPIHFSTCQALQDYARRRDRFYGRSTEPAFFVASHGRRLSHWAARRSFIQVSRRVGLRGPNDSHGPRLHDFRHSFAVKTLINWYRQGLDVEREMPKLSTYLGHAHWADTYWYLTSVPELMSLASDRLEQALGGLS